MEYKEKYEKMELVKSNTSSNCNAAEVFCQKKKEKCKKLSTSTYPNTSKYFQNEKGKQSSADEISDIEIIFENVVTQTPKMESLNSERTPSPIPIKNILDVCDKNPLKAVRRLKFDCNEQKTPRTNTLRLNEIKIENRKRKCMENHTESQKKIIIPSGLNDNDFTYSKVKLLKGNTVSDKADKDNVFSTSQNFKRNSECSISLKNSEASFNDLDCKTQGKINRSPKKREKGNFIPRKNIQTLKRTGMYQNLSQVSSSMLNYNKSFRRSKSDPSQYSNSHRGLYSHSQISESQSSDSINTENASSSFSASQKSDISTLSLSQNSDTLSDSSEKQCSQNVLQPTVTPNLVEESSNSSLHKTNDLWKSRYRHEKGIYLENFQRVLKAIFLSSKDLNLFDSCEQQMINGFSDISLAGQKLYLRLFLRKIGWIRKSKLNYPQICNINDVGAIIDELSSSKFVFKAICMDLSEILAVLTLPEVRQLARDVEVKCSGTKNALMKDLIKHSKTIEDGSDTILKRALMVLGSCCKLNVNVYKVFMRILILYFLPRFQCDDEGGPQAHLPSLLHLNMKNMKFPSYQVIRGQDIFRSRKDLISLETVKELESNIRESMENKEWKKALQYCKDANDLYKKSVEDEELRDFEISLPSFLRLFTATSALVFILNLQVDILQALRKYQAAMNQLHELLSQKTHLQDFRGHWYNRLALNLHRHLNKPNQALLIIHVALYEREVSSPHKLSLIQRALSIGQQHSHLIPEINKIPKHIVWAVPTNTIQGRSLQRSKSGHKRKFLSTDGNREECSVEQLAKEHYKKKGYTEGLHGENLIANSLFGMLFWDIIYASVPDAFRSQDQVAPLDLDTPHFYASRKGLIDTRLSLMSTWNEAMLQKELERVWQQHVGQDSLVAWYAFKNLNFLKGLVLSLGITTVAAICERLSKDHRFSKTGFPDLIVWNPCKKISRIVEVKGPGDVLSSNQSIWMDYLIDNNAAVEVCHVTDNSQRSAKKKKRCVQIKKD